MIVPETTVAARTAIKEFNPAIGVQKRRPRARLGDLWVSVVAWAPAALAAAAMSLPLLYLLLRTVQAGPAAWQILLRIQTLHILARTVWMALAVTTASTVVAVPLAWLTLRTDLPLPRLWTVLTALPLVIPSYVGAYLIIAALGPRGLLQQFLEGPLGVQRLPDIYGFPGAFLTLTLLSYPYALLSVRAGIQGLDPALEEASRSLGYGSWATFRRVVLPQLRPALASGGLLVALYSLRDFGAVSLLRYNTFTRVIYVQYQSSFNRAIAAAYALVLVAMTLIVAGLEARTRGRSRYYRTTAGSARPPKVTALGEWRWPALLFCAAVVFFSLGIPAVVLVYWLIRGLQAGEPLFPLWEAARNSMFASALAAVATLVAALSISVLTVRRARRATGWLERLTYSGFALPGIVIALALVFFSTRYAIAFYQTLPLLVVAYTVLFLAEAVGATRASLLRVGPSLEDAARSLGRGPLRVFATITLPLIRPGVLAGAGMVFLTTMKELPATLILSPIGFKTLATSVWSSVSEAFFARAAAPALLLILASSLPMAFLILREGSTER